MQEKQLVAEQPPLAPKVLYRGDKLTPREARLLVGSASHGEQKDQASDES